MVIAPSRRKMRTWMGNKIETVRIGKKAGVPSVPNVLAEVKSYEYLRKGRDLSRFGAAIGVW
jgi:biotin carboxylase